MRTIRARKKWIVVSTLLLISTLACQFLSQTKPSETSESGNISPTLTPTKNSTICPPENIAFPDPQELESYIGWQYVHVKDAFDYPDIMSGSLLSIDKHNDHGIAVYRLNDNSYILTLEKLLCYDSAGNPAWEIVDVIRINQISNDEVVSLSFTCTRNGEDLVDPSGENITDEFIIPIVNRTSGDVIFAWSIDKVNKKFVKTSIESLSC